MSESRIVKLPEVTLEDGDTFTIIQILDCNTGEWTYKFEVNGCEIATFGGEENGNKN
jgi:hypothetical protein